MNKFIIVVRSLIIITLSSLISSNDLMAHINPMSERAFEGNVEHVSDKLIIDRLENLSSVIDINFTPEVGRRIREYTVNYRVAGERILGRVDLFFPLFEAEIYKRNLPEELKYIAVVESHLDPTAKSSAGAMGLWQFVKSTGRMQGLKIDNYVDERRDPVKSTAAALDYLTHLYEEFNDWTLAIAAYNCGPGNIRKAIRRGNSKDYWDIRFYLPNETQKYVPRIIAAMYLMQYYHAHELIPENIDEDIRDVVHIELDRKHNLIELAGELDLPLSTLRKLNPQFKTNYIPKSNSGYTLIIPARKYEKYLELYDRESFGELLRKRKEAQEKAALEKRIEEIRNSRLERPDKLISIIYKELKTDNWKREIELDMKVERMLL